MPVSVSTQINKFLREESLKTSQQAAILGSISSPNAPITLANATLRKTLASYDPDGPIKGVTKVIQSDLAGIMWFFMGDDVTLDASWYGLPYTVDPDGDIEVSMELSNVSDVVPDEGVLGRRGSVVSLGDGITSGGQPVIMNSIPDGYLRVVSIQNSGTTSVEVKHDGADSAAGFTSGETGGTAVFDAVAADTSVSTTGISARSGLPIEYWVFPTTALGGARAGNITRIVTDTSVSEIDTSRLPLLSILAIYGPVKHLDLTGNPALISLIINNAEVTRLDLTPVKDVLTYARFDYCTKLVSLDLSILTAWDASGATALELTGCENLTTLDFSNQPIDEVDARLCSSLSSVIATGCVLDHVGFGNTGSYFTNGNMSFDALKAFHDSLGTAAEGFIRYGGNPGSAEFETYLGGTPAVSKGYTWENRL